jgi:hypothetical protein
LGERPTPNRRRGDTHALAVWDELDGLRRRVDDLVLTARVVAIMLAGHGGLELLELLA